MGYGIHRFIDDFVGANAVAEERERYRDMVKFCLIVTAVIAVLCIGVMYLRFRVF